MRNIYHEMGLAPNYLKVRICLEKAVRNGGIIPRKTLAVNQVQQGLVSNQSGISRISTSGLARSAQTVTPNSNTSLQRSEIGCRHHRMPLTHQNFHMNRPSINTDAPTGMPNAFNSSREPGSGSTRHRTNAVTDHGEHGELIASVGAVR